MIVGNRRLGLVLAATLLLGTSAVVAKSAAPAEDEAAEKTKVTSSTPAEERVAKEGESSKEWEEMVEDTDDETELGRKDREMLGLVNLPSGLSKMLVIVTWRLKDNTVNRKREALGWYSTLGTLVANNLIVAVPTMELKGNSTSDWLVKDVLVSLHDPAKRRRIGHKELVTTFPGDYHGDPDRPHRIAVIRLVTPLGEDSGMNPAWLVGNPLTPQGPPAVGEDLVHQDYALTSCELVLLAGGGRREGRHLRSLPASLARCVHSRTSPAGAAYEDRVCAYPKMPFEDGELLADRIFYPHDMGAPVFCSGLLVGVFMGVQNLAGTWHQVTGKPSPGNTTASGRALEPWEQYVVEVVGHGADWTFVRSLGDEQHHRPPLWQTLMTAPDEEECDSESDAAPHRGPEGRGDDVGAGEYGYDVGGSVRRTMQRRVPAGLDASLTMNVATRTAAVHGWMVAGVAVVFATLRGRPLSAA